MKSLLIIALIISTSLSKIADDVASIQTLRAAYKPKMPPSIIGSAKLVEGKKNRISS
jgi:hypothetical protein